MKHFILVLTLTFIVSACTNSQNPVVVISTPAGNIELEIFEKLVSNFKYESVLNPNLLMS